MEKYRIVWVMGDVSEGDRERIRSYRTGTAASLLRDDREKFRISLRQYDFRYRQEIHM